MRAEFNSGSSREVALLRLTQAAQLRAQGQVCNIEVSLEGTNGDSTFVVTGQSRNFYGVQLAQHGLMDSLSTEVLQELGLSHRPKIVSRIEVS